MPIDPLTGGFYAPGELGDPGTWYFEEINPEGGRQPYNVSGWCDGAVVPTAGYGGWSRVARPRKKALTEWIGRDSLSLTIDFKMGERNRDSSADQNDLAQRIRNLEHLAALDINDPEPPRFRLRSTPAGVIPHDYSNATQVEWFIETLNWDKNAFVKDSGGDYLTAGGTMVVTQYVAPEKPRPGKTSKKKNSGRRKTYRVRAGDTLQKIAARKDVYGNAKQWKKIAKANKIRDPKKLKTGRLLKIP